MDRRLPIGIENFKELIENDLLAQIQEKQCDAELRLEGYHTFIKYGIAFYKKLCKITVVV